MSAPTPVDAQAWLAAERLKWDEKHFQSEVLKLGQGTAREPRLDNPWNQAYHTFFSNRSESGWPDLTWTRRGVLLFAELKAEKGMVSAAQKRVLAELTEVSHEISRTITELLDLSTPTTPMPWEDQSACWPPMGERFVQVWLWRPSHWDTIVQVLA